MPFSPDAVSTVTFDSYSTLVDVDAVTDALGGRVDDPESVSRLWRTRSLRYALVCNAIDAYEPFYELLRHALDYALAAHDEHLSAPEREEILATYHRLDVFDDVREGIERLVAADYDVFVLSNGNPAMLDSLVDNANVADLLTDTVSADEIRTYKPAVDLYRYAAGRTGTPIDAIAHVSAGWLDVQGASHAGMQGVRLNRAGLPDDPFGPDPALSVGSIHELADRLGA